MGNLKLDSRVVGEIGTNCYFAVNSSTGEGFFVDPGDEALRLEQMADKAGGKPAAILLTHGHFDHITAVAEIRERYHIPVYACREEQALLARESQNLSEGRQAVALTADHWLQDGQQLTIAGFQIRAIHTPGHTAGGMCYYLPEEHVLFSGDTLFAESVGRTDFPTGSMSAIVHSVRDKLMTLPEETAVFPGHGPGTTIAHEKEYNPYL